MGNQSSLSVGERRGVRGVGVKCMPVRKKKYRKCLWQNEGRPEEKTKHPYRRPRGMKRMMMMIEGLFSWEDGCEETLEERNKDHH